MPVQTRFHIRRRIFALVICLAFSSLLWLLNDLNKIQTTTVQIPIRITGLPYDMVTTNSLPTSMEATVEATGFTLLFRQFSLEKNIVEIPLRLEQGMVSPGRNYLFNVNYYLQDISEALGSHLKIRRLFPDTFSIAFEKKFVKKVPVFLAADVQFEREFASSDKVLLKPDSIIISGTKDRVNAIDSLSTQPLKLRSLKKTYEGVLGLEYINGISYNVNEVNVTLPVEQFTEKLISLKIIPTNVPPNFELNTIPDMVELKILVPISNFNNVHVELFQVSAEFPNQQTDINKILLKVDKKPEFVKVIGMEPAAVEFKIKQKF